MEGLAKKITESSFWLSASKLLSRFVSFGAVIIITRLMNLYDYGALMLVLTVSAPVSLFSSFGVEAVMISDMARFRGEKMFGNLKKLLRSYIIVKLAGTTIIVAAGWFLKPFLVAQFGNFINDFFYILVVWIYAVILYSILSIILNAHEEFKVLSVSDLSEVSVKTALILIFWLANIINIKFVLLAYVIGKATNVVILFFFSINRLRYLKNIKSSEEPVFRNLIFRHGKWDVISQTFLQQIDGAVRPWIVKFFIGVEGVAIFSVAGSIYSALMGLVPLKQVIFPIISRNINDKATNIIIAQKATKYSFIFYFFTGLASFFLISPFIHIFFLKYVSSILLFRLLLGRMLITATGYSHEAFFYAYKEQKKLFMFELINAAALFSILPISMKLFGLPGVYVERLITIPIMYISREYYLRKKYNIATWNFRSLFQYDVYDKRLVGDIVRKIKEMYCSIVGKKALV